MLDKAVSAIAFLGVPGLALLLAVSATGYAGAAALTTALAALGPGGMVGGIATLGAMGLISLWVSQFGFDSIFKGVVAELEKRGETAESIIDTIDGYPISKKLKCTLKEKFYKSNLIEKGNNND